MACQNGQLSSWPEFPNITWPAWSQQWSCGAPVTLETPESERLSLTKTFQHERIAKPHGHPTGTTEACVQVTLGNGVITSSKGRILDMMAPLLSVTFPWPSVMLRLNAHMASLVLSLV